MTTGTFKSIRAARLTVPRMTPGTVLRSHVSTELAAASSAFRDGDVAEAWRRLERGHILSQPSAWLHTRVHWAMLVLSVRVFDLRELVGQLVRLAVAGIGSTVGRFPVGNTGRARAPLTMPMPVPDDLAATLSSALGAWPSAR